MTGTIGAGKACLLAASCLLLALPAAHAQNASVATSADSARAALAEKARAFEARGRPDMAIQLWQQILLSAPGNTEALAALASDYKLTGSTEQSDQALDRLRRIKPHDPNLAGIPSTPAESAQLHRSHSQSTEYVTSVNRSGAKPTRSSSGVVRNPAERAAFEALNAHQLDAADRRFAALLEAEPGNGRVEAGMGFLRAQQQNFAEAIHYFTLARQHGYSPAAVDDALASSRFNLALDEALEALRDNHLDLAESRFRAALDSNGHNAEALRGLADVYVKQQQFIAAAGIYEELVRVNPASAAGWRGLFLAYARSDQNEKALAVAARIPSSVTAALNKDPGYLRTLAAIDQAQGRDSDAQRVLTLALALPFPGNGSSLDSDTKMQYAGILLEARRYPGAIALYNQLIAADPASLPAWVGLISAQHEFGRDSLAVAAIQKIPPSTYESALRDPGSLSLFGAVFLQVNQSDVAQSMLERAEKLIISSHAQPSVSLQLQLADLYLLRDNPDRAGAIYRSLTTDHPENAGAWKGLVSSLAAANRISEALRESERIPAAVRQFLDSDIGFMQTEAGVYAAGGDNARAAQWMNRVLAHYAKAKQPAAPAVDIQNAWLLYEIGYDRALYPTLMRIGGRDDLTVAQRETVQEIWVDWSVRRASAAMEDGDAQRAVDILDAASLAFPGNGNALRTAAGGYARIGRAQKALALYKTLPMQDASSDDFAGAVGAALAANDRSQAEQWLRQALDRFPHDPAILALAARFEQALGDNERAAEYYRESLAAMPPVTPADRLAHALIDPGEIRKAHRAVTAADLERLLDPANEPFSKTARMPLLPACGPDPFDGPAPVATPEQQLPPKPARPPTYTPQTEPAVNFVPQTLHIMRFGHEERAPYARHSFVSLGRVYSGRSAAFTAHLVFASLASTRSASVFHFALQSAAAIDGEPEITVNPPRSLASEAWKGLVFSLIAANRNAEALMELSKIPPEVRLQLAADIEWVQGVASLYVAVGDTPHASAWLKRVDDFYLLHRGDLPAAIEIQHAWLLDNIHRDIALYSVLQRLDARSDLSSTDRQQVNAIWINWAIRRASDDLSTGDLQGGIQILQAAALEYADSMLVRRALAAAYVHAGQTQQALAVYKTIPMDSATAGDFAGAIGAGMAVGDMAQSESWLRLALARYPGDAQVLALAAHFEQARGNNQRAGDFWRAALAAMPAGSDAINLTGTPGPPVGYYPAPATGLHRLLDPRRDSHRTPEEIAPLPSYSSRLSSPAYTDPQSSSGESEHTLPSSNPLPLPSAEQGSNASAPALIAQSNTISPPVSYGPGPFALPAAPDVYTGLASNTAGNRSLEMPQTWSAESNDALAPAPTANLPSSFVPLRAAPSSPAPEMPKAQPTAAQPAAPAEIAAVQTAPSIEQAITGAYSAPQQVHPALQPNTLQPAITAQSKPKPSSAASRSPLRAKPAPQATTAQPLPQPVDQPPEQTLGDAQIAGEPPENPTAPSPSPGTDNVTQTSLGPAGEELAQQNPSPLRGAWTHFLRQANPPNPREEAEDQLRAIEGGYSGWLGPTASLSYRGGAPGYDQLAAIEAPLEVSTPLGFHARLVAIAMPVFLDSGSANGAATLAVVETTGSGTSQVAIPEPIGTLASTSTTLPAQQNATGLGGELQLVFPHLAIAGGYTPANFLVATFTGRFDWHPSNGPLMFSLSREPVKDSELSYAGLRDPAGNTLTTLGQIWGGVVANQAQIQFHRSGAQSGFYFSADGQYLTGYNTENNARMGGAAGAYWGVFTSPEYGELSIGANFSGMHYTNNQNAYTFGMGGYFSPQAYFLAEVPINWSAHWQTHWHYAINGALGVRAFQQSSAPLWPFAAQKALEVSLNNAMLPAITRVSPNYDFKSEVAYQVNPHLFAGVNVIAGNSRDYNFASFGFFLRYTFREQPSAAAAPTGLFPTEGIRPFTVP